MKSKNPFISWRKNIFQKKYIFLGGIFVVFFFGLSFLWAACDADIICYDQKIEGTSGTAHTWGSFDPDGNAGIVNFNAGNVVMTRGDINGVDTQYLSGWLWSETVGWMHFDKSIGALVQLQIADRDANIRVQNTLSGWLWSENAGWIQMNPPGGGVNFNTEDDRPALNGWAYSSNLGWIGLGNTLVATTLGDGLIGKVKVIGNLSGNNIFDVLYNVGSSFAGQNTATTLNKIRKNIALLTRRLPVNDMTHHSPTNAILYYRPTDFIKYSDIDVSGSEYFSKQSRTLIVEGQDLVIDKDISIPSGAIEKGPKSIIVLTNKEGSGGNIVIKGNVKNIYATLIAEKSILSGFAPGSLYNDTKENVLSALPQNQLYIKGSVISYNTIGGSSNAEDNFRCPYFHIGPCKGTESLRYDFNYFRNFQGAGASDKSGYDDYSFIIEFDPKALSDPPPGLSF